MGERTVVKISVRFGTDHRLKGRDVASDAVSIIGELYVLECDERSSSAHATQGKPMVNVTDTK